MTPAERIVAAVAWCMQHDAIVRFQVRGVQVSVRGRTERAPSLTQAVELHWPEMPE